MNNKHINHGDDSAIMTRLIRLVLAGYDNGGKNQQTIFCVDKYSDYRFSFLNFFLHKMVIVPQNLTTL